MLDRVFLSSPIGMKLFFYSFKYHYEDEINQVQTGTSQKRGFWLSLFSSEDPKPPIYSPFWIFVFLRSLFLYYSANRLHLMLLISAEEIHSYRRIISK